ncbi:hypothetical protein FCH33_23225 [Serratia fonticola]|uniref:hypothetical protein n=1 Tax=Serratia fonticola TaxID=47917 RepID=UPI0015765F74|nr:hypothetical protein [Serratia fonticola]NTY89686.1 hypothetical protein [Serratia fonticola]NTZ15516.1 hypothetical protein [Serratia fonticola]
MEKKPQSRTKVIYAMIEYRLSALLVILLGVVAFWFVPEIVREYEVKFTFPDVVPFQRLEAYIIAGVPIYSLFMILGFYVIITGKTELYGHKNYTKIKTCTVWFCRITMFNFLIAIIFNWHFTTMLDVHGYGYCWKSGPNSEVLYIKDASECKKRGTQVLKRPRAVYRR